MPFLSYLSCFLEADLLHSFQLLMYGSEHLVDNCYVKIFIFIIIISHVGTYWWLKASSFESQLNPVLVSFTVEIFANYKLVGKSFYIRLSRGAKKNNINEILVYKFQVLSTIWTRICVIST